MALSLLAFCVVAPESPAATPSTSFGVSATVLSSCAVSATSLAFGPYTAATVNATSAISVTCTSSTPYNIGLGAGTSPAASVASRQMSGPAASLLRYALMSNSARTLNWGNTAGHDTVAGTGNGSAQLLMVYGQTPAAQAVIPGSYADTITVTVTY